MYCQKGGIVDLTIPCTQSALKRVALKESKVSKALAISSGISLVHNSLDFLA